MVSQERESTESLRIPELPTQADMIIVGAGMAGSALALEMKQKGVRCVVLESHWGEENEVRHPVDYPIIIAGTTFRTIFPHLSMDEVCIQDMRILSRFSGLIKAFADLYTSKKAVVVTTLDVARKSLWQQLKDNEVPVYSATATELVIEDERVTGVKALYKGTQTRVHTPVVVDATGRQRKLIGKVGEKSDQESKQPTELFGMMLTLPDHLSLKYPFEQRQRTAVAGIASEVGVGVCFASVLSSQAPSPTHVFMMEGKSDAVQKLKRLQGQELLAELNVLFGGTQWSELLAALQPQMIASTYSWRFATQNRFAMADLPTGFTAVGDAAFTVNFVTGRGMQAARRSVDMLSGMLEAEIDPEKVSEFNAAYDASLKKEALKHKWYYKLITLFLGKGK